MKTSVKFSILAAAFLMLSTGAGAQGKYGADSAECIKYLSYYKEYFKQKSYDEATPNWRQAYRICPATASQNMIIDGTTLVRRLIAKNALNPIYRKQLIDTLLTLHDVRAQYYPKYAVTAMNNKSLDVANYLKDDASAQYSAYEAIIANNREDTKYQTFLFDLNAAITLYQSGMISAEEVINVYQRNSGLLEESPAKNEIEKGQKEKIKVDLGNIFASSKVASCDNLIELYGKRADEIQGNVQFATSIVKTMSSVEDCQSNDIYLAAVSTMYKMDPSAKSAYYLFKLYSATGDNDNAEKYMEEAINLLGEDNTAVGEYSYELATFCYKNGKTGKAYELAGKVPALNETLAGKAYFLMGSIWGASNCGGNEVTRRAPYWVACDFMNKAKAADPSLGDEANSRIASYSRYFPEAAEAFMYDITSGQSYTVVCGSMRATTTVRTVK